MVCTSLSSCRILLNQVKFVTDLCHRALATSLIAERLKSRTNIKYAKCDVETSKNHFKKSINFCLICELWDAYEHNDDVWLGILPQLFQPFQAWDHAKWESESSKTRRKIHEITSFAVSYASNSMQKGTKMTRSVPSGCSLSRIPKSWKKWWFKKRIKPLWGESREMLEFQIKCFCFGGWSS